MRTEALVAWIAIGLIAGLVARFAIGGNMIRLAIAGMLGGLIAGWVVVVLQVPIPIYDYWTRQIAVALAGAAIVIAAARTLD